jgi:phosphatidylserine/phosphatidylglycerophosphate/cardiolipin synthase-like enzyme
MTSRSWIFGTKDPQLLSHPDAPQPFRNLPRHVISVGATWANGQPFSNHAKLVAVDDEAFYIGSQNLYPGRFQELGVIVEIEMPRTN